MRFTIHFGYGNPELEMPSGILFAWQLIPAGRGIGKNVLILGKKEPLTIKKKLGGQANLVPNITYALETALDPSKPPSVRD